MVDDAPVNLSGRKLIVSILSARSFWLAPVLAGIFIVFAVIAGPPAAQAADTVWICKPGQVDDLCAGTINGSSLPAPGETAEPLPYTRPANPPVDCFYLYPTQSEQATPNSDLEKDPPIKRVVVQQARMFSSVCKVYAPMYRQVTFSGDQSAYNPSVETAYDSARAAFQDYLANYNKGRGFIMIGHSQGSAHTVRLIDEMIDRNPVLRKRFVGAITPGGNVHVPIGKKVGGMFANVPACSKEGEFGCIIAYSMYADVPGPTAEFSRLDNGYWIYPQARPDDSRFEVMCVNPARLDGSDGTLLPLANLDYLYGVPVAETAAPWISEPDYYGARCERQNGAHWLNVSKTDLPGDARPNLGTLVGSGTNWHVPELNLAEGNLLTFAGNAADSYLAEQSRIAGLKAKLGKLNTALAKAQKRAAKYGKLAKALTRKAGKAEGRQKRLLAGKAAGARVRAAAERGKIRKLRKQISQLKKKIG